MTGQRLPWWLFWLARWGRPRARVEGQHRPERVPEYAGRHRLSDGHGRPS